MTIPFGWVMPNFHDFILLSLVGIMGGSANLFLTQSYKLSEVSLVAPLKYLSLIFAIIFGYLIWNEVPTTKTLIGASLVVSASLIIFRREIYHKEKIPSATRHE
jgi:drug/metabolite transporter (DMT)-like permease